MVVQIGKMNIQKKPDFIIKNTKKLHQKNTITKI